MHSALRKRDDVCVTEGRKRERESRNERIDRLCKSLRAPVEGAGSLDALLVLKRELLDEVAHRARGLIEVYVARQPQSTITEKQALAQWINSQLRGLDLAIQCERTGMPAKLIVNTTRDSRGRYHLAVTMPDGRVSKTINLSVVTSLPLRSRDGGVSKKQLWSERCASDSQEGNAGRGR